MKKLLKNQKGFTIIEVMIVLVIAAVILLIVFIAVPALQRNARNTTRKDEAANILAASGEYSANANGAIPVQADSATILANANNKEFTTLTIQLENGTAVPTNFTTAVLRTGAKCNPANNETDAGASLRQIALLYPVETAAGAVQVVCQGS